MVLYYNNVILIAVGAKVKLKPLPMAYAAETEPCFQRHERLKWGFWIDHPFMEIDMNVSKLDTIEQIKELLEGTADVLALMPN